MRIEVNPMPFTSSSTSSWKSGGGVVPEKFPAGLRVLVVDDDPTCLRILEKMLRNCLYEVTKCSRAEVALKLLRDNKNSFDIVISDVHMPDMDGFKLLEHVGLEMDLPVIMMSADDSTNVVMKGVKHGACDYLIKPVSMEALKIIWQHVVHRKKHEWVDKDMEQLKSAEDGERQQKPSEDVDYSSSGNEGSSKNSNKRKDEEDEDEDRDYKSKSKKPRVVWTKQLQDQFISAVNQIGIDKAVPKKILEVMNVPGLTRENVASHLQKFRLYFRKLSGQVQNGLVNSIVGPTSINGVASSNQFPPRSLSTLQSTPLGRSTNRSPVSEPLNVSRNIFAYQNPMIRFAQGQQQQHRHFNSNSEVSLLRGISTNTDSTNMPFANMNNGSNSLLTQMIQPQPRHQILNHGIGSNVFMNRPLSSTYSSISQPTTTFSPVSDLGIAALTSNAILQHDLEQETNVSRGIVPTYDVFDDLNQNRTDDWELEIVEAPQHSNTQSRLDFAPSILVQPGFQQQQNSSPADNLSGVQNSFFTDDHDDFMNAYLNQNHHDVSSESEFAFDAYQLDNLPM